MCGRDGTVHSSALPFPVAGKIFDFCWTLRLNMLCVLKSDYIFILTFSCISILSQHVQDPLPEMRSISCWVLSRYCSLYECMNDSDASSNSPTVASVGSVYYTQTLQVLLSTMFDAMPKVQIAACSALAILIENSFYVSSSDNNNDSDSILLPHVHTILSACARAFDVYGVKASLVLVDTIGTIADTIGKCSCILVWDLKLIRQFVL